MTQRYSILDTQPTVYQDKTKGIVNGVLVRVTLLDYDEVHEIRVPEMKVTLVQTAVETLLAERDQLAGLGNTEE